MIPVRVWAPRPSQVELLLGDRRIPLRRDPHDWWTSPQAVVPFGSDYAFSLDGGPPRPDPRSRWQPHGVHGFSRACNLNDFSWTDQSWQAGPLGSALFYELHVGTFSAEGTFDGAIAHLRDLRDLGVTHVEIMPVGEFPGRHGWGYDGVDLFAPHHAYGGPAGLMRLVDACHAAGLAVVLDVVYNHLGPNGNYLAEFGPYFTTRYHTPWGQAVNFDGPDSDEVRRFVCDNALMWLRDYHFDALRLDAVHAIFDTSAVHILEQMAGEVQQLEDDLGRRLRLIAESDLNDPRLVRTPEIGGFGLAAQWSDDYHHALHTLVTGERGGYYADFGGVAELAQALTSAYVYDGRHSHFRRRRHGRPATGLPGHRFLAYLQNHDQVGNRARGDRIGHIVHPDMLKAAAAVTLTSPFIPLLFQGEEWGASSPFQYFTDHEDAELGRLVREGRRAEFAAFGWDPEEIPDPQDPATFERCRLKWDERVREPHRSLLRWHQELIRLRRREPGLNDGDLNHVAVDFQDGLRWILIARPGVRIACNFDERACRIPLDTPAGVVLLASGTRIQVLTDAVELPPRSAIILKIQASPDPRFS